ncbi:MAG: hypothetical protein AAB632_00180 [Patescibacteria group bacterium]
MKKIPKDIDKELKKFMEPDERFIDFRKEPWSFYKRNRWVILTGKRIYLIKKVFFGFSFDIIQILISDAHLEFVEGIILDTIFIRVSSEPEHIIQFFSSDRDSTIEFFRKIEKKREGEPEGSIVAQAELEALAQVFYEKLITKEEYEEKKKELMDKL